MTPLLRHVFHRENEFVVVDEIQGPDPARGWPISADIVKTLQLAAIFPGQIKRIVDAVDARCPDTFSPDDGLTEVSQLAE